MALELRRPFRNLLRFPASAIARVTATSGRAWWFQFTANSGCASLAELCLVVGVTRAGVDYRVHHCSLAQLAALPESSRLYFDLLSPSEVNCESALADFVWTLLLRGVSDEKFADVSDDPESLGGHFGSVPALFSLVRDPAQPERIQYRKIRLHD